MYAPTANGTTLERVLEQPQITESSPNVATNSLNHCEGPLRACWERETIGSPNIKWATIAPLIPPEICARI